MVRILREIIENNFSKNSEIISNKNNIIKLRKRKTKRTNKRKHKTSIKHKIKNPPKKTRAKKLEHTKEKFNEQYNFENKIKETSNNNKHHFIIRIKIKIYKKLF